MFNKKTKNQTFIVVDFLDIDTKKITLNNPKPNNYVIMIRHFMSVMMLVSPPSV